MSHALLIDGENLSCTHAAAILGAMPPDAPVRRVYGDVVRLNGWLSVGGLRAVHTSQGKNAADMQIAIDSMEFLLRDGIRNFAIATSDGDFIPLFARLRESGACVTLLGTDQASECLRRIAHRFVRLAPPPLQAEAQVATVEKSAVSGTTGLAACVFAKVREGGKAGIMMTDLNALVRRELEVNIGAEPEKTWRGWLTAPGRKGAYHCDPKGPAACVRLTTPTP